MLIKSYYASAISLKCNRDPRRVYFDLLDVGETDKMVLVFVHSEEEAEGYEEGIIVAWPSAKTEITLIRINRYIEREGIDISRFSLEYPLTMENLVDNWEPIEEFLREYKQAAR